MANSEVKLVTEVDSAEKSFNYDLRKQLEFYYGDVNLPRDRFIGEEEKKHDGWMPVALLLKFNRVRDMVSKIAEEKKEQLLVDVLRESDLIELNEDGTKIRRNPAIPIPVESSIERTVYLKGFHKTETSLDELLEFFKKYEGMEAVIMRYYKEKNVVSEGQPQEGDDDCENESSTPVATVPTVVWARKFKGSVFVVFKTKENADTLVKDTTVSYKGNTLLKMYQTLYKEKKLEEYKTRIEARKQKEKGAKKPKLDSENQEAAVDKEPGSDLVKGALIRVKGIPEGFSRETLKDKWYEATNKEEFSIAFVDFNIGEKDAVLRLDRADSAKEALALLEDGKLKVGDTATATVEGFDDEEEKKYLGKIKQSRANKRKRGNPGRGGRGRGGKRGKRRY